MSIKLAINGFGRIGRLAFRRAYDVGGFEVVAINDLVDAKTLAYLLKYDTTHRGWHQDEIDSEVVKDEAGNIIVNNLIWKGKKIPVLGQKDPKNLKWSDYKVDLVLECTGRFKGVADAMVHVENGAKGVIISAPSDKDTPTFVYGVNTDKLTKDMKVISGASCTTNCLAPVMTPVYCCGESLDTFNKGETKKFVAEQIRVGLKDLTPEEAAKVVIAYEPIWAIGTGKSASKEIAEDTIGFIRRTLRESFGNVALDMRILYGGSVKPENVAEYMVKRETAQTVK